jgi:hypothetical protein
LADLRDISAIETTSHPALLEELMHEGMYLRFKCRVVEPLIEIIIALLL